MRILHTSDWHLGARLGNQDRTDDQFARLEELGVHIDREEPDVLLVAGDVFDEHRADNLARIIGRLARLLKPRIEAGLTAVFVAGNHDREHVFPLLRGLQELVAPGDERRVIFTERPGLIPVTGRSGDKIQLVLVPYPTPMRYDLADQHWPSPEHKRQGLAAAVRARLRELERDVRLEGKGIPPVLAGHLLIRGVTDGLCYLSEAQDVPIEAGDLPSYAYVALGHIHKAQEIGSSAIRYCGSIERMDRGEAANDNGALLVEVTRSGLQDVRPLPLRATPIARVEASSSSELEAAAASMQERERTLVSLVLSLQRGQATGELQELARRLFPRIYGHPEVHWIGEEPRLAADLSLSVDRHNVPATVRAYLAKALEGDPDSDALLQLAEQLLADTGVGP